MSYIEEPDIFTTFDFNPQDKKAEIEALVKAKTGKLPIWGICSPTRIAFRIEAKLSDTDKKALQDEIKKGIDLAAEIDELKAEVEKLKGKALP